MGEKITASMIIEVIGKPPEHLVKTLEGIAEKIAQTEKIELVSKKIHKEKELEKIKGFYSNFMEVEIIAESVKELTGIVLFYMPSHVEIIDPEKIKIENSDITEILNAITRKLHLYDETARAMKAKEINMEKKMKELENKKTN